MSSAGIGTTKNTETGKIKVFFMVRCVLAQGVVK